MLTQLDTVIGFVVVMSVVSLLIMVVTQIFSSFLGLRGKNLADALQTMFIQLAPSLDHTACTHLIHMALTDPAMSDSVLSMQKKEGVILRNIPWLRYLRNRWKKATAIRHEELYAYLQGKTQGPITKILDIAEDVKRTLVQAKAAIHAHVQTSPFTSDLRRAVSKLTHAINAFEAIKRSVVTSETSCQLSSAIEGAFLAADGALLALENLNPKYIPGTAAFSIKNAIGSLKVVSATKVDYEAARARLPDAHLWPAAVKASLAAKHVMTALRNRVAADVGAVKTGAASLASAEEAAKARFETWFNSVQDRAQQWFTMHARILTVIGAFTAAIVLPLDTVELIGTLSSNPDVRAKLVSQADAIERQTEAAVNQTVDQAAHTTIMAEIRRQYPTPAISSNLNNIHALSSLSSVEEQLRQDLTAAQNSNTEAIVQKYHTLYLLNSLGSYKKEVDAMGKSSVQESLNLVPNPYPLAWNHTQPKPHWYSLLTTQGDYWAHPMRRVIGILLSAALLSLGGPFWFNLLQQLSNLRPALAGAVDADDTKKPAPNGQPT